MFTRYRKIILVCWIVLITLLLKVDYGKADTEEAEIKKFIETYFHFQYQCLAKLEEHEIEEFYFREISEGEKAYRVDKEALSYIIGCRSMQDNDLRLKHYRVDLDYKVIQVSEERASVKLVENSEFQFSFLKNIPSQKNNIQHRFELKKNNGEWKICTHDSTEDEFRIISDGITEFRSYEGVKEFYLDLMRQNKNNIEKAVRTREDDENELKKEKEDVVQSYSNENKGYLNYYKREKAVNYAKQWSQNGAKLRNSPPWANYDPPLGNGDCTNFVSQCIHAGGIPMDHKGKEYEQWKWYDNNYNPAQTAKGRVASWTGVEGLYNYCRHNKGFGMAASVDSTWNEAQIGDVVQLGKTKDDFFHSIIITEYVYDDSDILKDFLICCHTTDRYNYPLSAYSYPLKRYIHIKGWSD
jgi:hypothetical protein